MRDDDRAPAPPNLRHNLLVLGADFGTFRIGQSFASESTILPAFAAELGAPNVVIGAIPAVSTLGWFLPPLFAAGHTESLPRKLPFVMRYTIWERVPLLVLAFVAFFVAERRPSLSLGILLAMLLIMTGSGGVLLPAWMDIVGRLIPINLRGRFFAVSSALANVGGLAGSAVTAWILATVVAPASYGVCFLVAAAWMGVSYVALAMAREPIGPVSEDGASLWTRLGRVPGLLRRDRNLSWFLGGRALAMLGGMGGAFYTVHALRTHGAPAWQAGVFTMLLLGGELVGNGVLGWLGDRVGHRVVVITGVAAMLGANLIALAAPSVGVLACAFALWGVQIAAVHVSNLNILLEFAPDPAERPTYIGLGTTVLVPVAFGAPLAAGAVADVLGFAAVFAIAAGAGVLSLVVLGRVRDPRRSNRTALATPSTG